MLRLVGLSLMLTLPTAAAMNSGATGSASAAENWGATGSASAAAIMQRTDHNTAAIIPRPIQLDEALEETGGSRPPLAGLAEEPNSVPGKGNQEQPADEVNQEQVRVKGDKEQVRKAVSQSLVFLEKEGVAWIDERGCMSCHHVPFLIWSHRAAQSKGIPIDPTKLSEWEDWARNDSLSHRNLYRLQDYELKKIDPGKLPVEIRTKLKPLIEEPFKTELDFVTQLSKLLSEDERKLYQEILLKTAERKPNDPDRVGGGLDVLGQLLLGNPNELAQAEFRRGVFELMAGVQLEEGSWTPGNQLATMRRWSLPTANQSTTMWAALALAASEGPNRSRAVEKAIAYQSQQPSFPENREWLATRLLFESQFGSPKEFARLNQLLIEARNSDGGWGWDKDVPSDAYTTGLAVYVLARSGRESNSVPLDEAVKWLLAFQQTDGSWLTPSKNITKSTEPERLKARDEIYHYWGTAWGAIGLLETLEFQSP